MSAGPEPADGAGGPTARWRHWLWIVVVVLAGLQLWRDPTDSVARILAVVGLIGLLVAFGFAVQHVELWTRRPRKTYLRWALAVAALGLALVVLPLTLGASVVIGLMLWTGFSAAGLAWVHHYERTEPL